jgi:DNA replication and repair protein RecF
VTTAYGQIAGADHAARLHSRLSILATAPPSGYSTGAGGDDEVEDETANRDGVITADTAAANFRDALARVRKAELDRGLTLVGPHRDDLVLDLNGMPARGYASHGESWSFALALKLASAQVLRRESQAGDPVLMLDDVFAELDESRRDRLADAIADYEQVLITAAVFGDVPERLAGNVVRIRAGAVVEQPDGE